MIQNLFRILRQRIFSLHSPQLINNAGLNADVVIQEITTDNVHRVAEFRSQRLVDEFRKLLQQGQVGVYALVNSKVVGHGWAYICRKSRCRVNGYMDICPGEAFIHFCNVSQSQRGRGVYPTMLIALCRSLFALEEVSRVLIDTESDNVASLRGISKVGFEPAGKGWYLQIGGRLFLKIFTPANKAPSTESGDKRVR